MITAKIVQATIEPASVLRHYQEVLSTSRSAIARGLRESRARSQRYAHRIREHAKKEGSARGYQESSHVLGEALRGIKERYEDASRDAYCDLAGRVQEILGVLIPTYLKDHPEELSRWIAETASLVRGSQQLTLRYNPRYHDLFSHTRVPCPPGMRVVEDGSIGSDDFIIDSEDGEIRFDYASLITPLCLPEEAAHPSQATSIASPGDACRS